MASLRRKTLGCMTVVTIAGFLLAAWRLTESTILAMRGVETTGTVVALQSASDSDSDWYEPIIEFKTANGVTTRFKSAHAWSGEIGSKVPVRYDPQRPQRAELNSFDEIWRDPIAIFIAVLLLLALPTAVLLYFWRTD